MIQVEQLPNYTQLLRLWLYVSSFASTVWVYDDPKDPVETLKRAIAADMIMLLDRTMSKPAEELYQQGRIDMLNELLNGGS